MDIVFAMLGVTMLLVPIVSAVSLFLILKITRIEKPNFWVWLGIELVMSMATSMIGMALSIALPSVQPGFIITPIALLLLALVAYILHRSYELAYKSIILVIALSMVVPFAVGNGLMMMTQKSLFSETVVADDGMAPQLVSGDRIQAQRLNGKYVRDDLVELHNPYGGDGKIDNKVYVRRIAGLPGETVEMKQGKVFINGKETLIPSNNKITTGFGVETDFPESNRDTTTDLSPITLGDGEYFILSDKATVGNDSRTIGPVKTSGDVYISKKVVLKVSGTSIFDKDGIGYSPVE